ncbi:unnamed protein product [Urochloa decumbens]|uniref:RNase H type-1 domain-containing protein n=1 Tax=Urochloa decumbens TaxID=240449 RepID=A0ABC8VF38_9POAL
MASSIVLPVSAIHHRHPSQLPSACLPTQRWQPVQRHATPAAYPPPPPPRTIRVRWTPPRTGWYKLNFDGSVLHDGSGRASIGGAIRDSAGRVAAAFAERTPHAPIGVVEARALIRGLRLAEDGGFIHRLVVEGDDLTLVRLLRGESRQTRISRDVEEDILELLGRFRGGCEVHQHVYREGNRVADALCHEAYRCPGVWIDRTVPFRVYEKVEDDRHGVAHDRALLRV